MSEEKEENKADEFDILDEIKIAEKMIKRAMLLKTIGKLKKIAREILEAKEESNALLEAIGIDSKDAKRIIDFVNNLPEVRLTEKDKQKIVDEIQHDTEKGKKEVRDALEKKAYELTTSNPIMGQQAVYRWENPAGNLGGVFNYMNGISTNGLNVVNGSDSVMLCASSVDGSTTSSLSLDI